MPLANTTIRSAQSKAKAYRLWDGYGLYIEVSPKGGKWWRYKYRFRGKEKRLSLGTYPAVGLKEARDLREAASGRLAAGIDPSQHKRQHRLEQQTATTFQQVATEWFEKHQPSWSASHGDRIIRRLERDVFPWVGQRAVNEIEAPEILSVLRRIEKRGAVETAHRAKQNCGQVFRYAVATGRAKRDPTTDLNGALPPPRLRHYPTLTEPQAIAELLRSIDGYQGSLITRQALRLAPLVFVRPGELRHAEWSEINLNTAEWRIPAPKTKRRRAHVVPLSTQALATLKELHPLTGAGHYLFPGRRMAKRPMSENTVNAALRNLGYAKEQMTGHGFRSMASTLLNENGWSPDAIERQLAHVEGNSVRAAYNYADYLDERRRMMQWWADYLDDLKVLPDKPT